MLMFVNLYQAVYAWLQVQLTEVESFHFQIKTQFSLPNMNIYH